MIDDREWDEVRALFRRAFRSSLHFAVASAGPDGQPLVTPIGSVMLGEPGRAVFLERFAVGLGRRLAADPRVSVLAVDAGRWTWLRALLADRFDRPPAARLVGRVVAERAVTDAERERFERRVGPARRLPGGRTLWGAMGHARAHELAVDRVDWVRLGPMTG